MAEVARFFDAISYGEADQAEVQKRFRPNGVLHEADVNRLVVSAPGGMFVRVASGEAMVEGFWYKNTANLDLAIAGNSSGSTRFDRVVLRLNRTANTLALAILQGTPGAGIPALTQVAGGTYEFPLALVTVATGTLAITGAMLTAQQTYGNILHSGLEIGVAATTPLLTVEPGQLKRFPTMDVNNGNLYLEPAPARKNVLHNSSFRVNQRNASAVTANADWPCDRWQYAAITPNGYSSISVDLGATIGGYQSEHAARATKFTRTATTAPASNTFVSFAQGIEGQEYSGLQGLGLLLSFWAFSNKTGTYGASFEQAGTNWKYVGTFTINATYTWEFKYMYIPWSVVSGWNGGASVAAYVRFVAAAGTSERCSLSNAWVNEAGHAAAGVTNSLTAVSDELFISTPKLEVAPSNIQLPTRWELPDLAAEYMQCYRYVYVVKGMAEAWMFQNTSVMVPAQFPVQMRGVPTFSIPVVPSFIAGAPGASQFGVNGGGTGGYISGFTYSSWILWLASANYATSLIASSTPSTGTAGSSAVLQLGGNVLGVWSAEI